MNAWMLYGIAALMVLLPAMMIGQKYELKKITLMAGCIAASALIINLPFIQVFKFAGMYAEMRQTVDQAGVTVVQLRALAVELTRETLVSTVYVDRQRRDLRHAFDVRKAVIARLQKLGASATDVKQATSDFDQLIEWSFANDIKNSVNSYIQVPRSGQTVQDLNDKITAVEKDIFGLPNAQVAASGDIEKALSKVIRLPAAIQDEIADLEAFQQDGSIRRPDLFYRMDNTY